MTASMEGSKYFFPKLMKSQIQAPKGFKIKCELN